MSAVLWIKSETFDHGVFNTSIRWTVSKVLDFMGSLRVAVAATNIPRSTWVEVATTRCKPVLSETEAIAYWHVFTVLQQAVAGQGAESIDIRFVGIVLMCQVFSPNRGTRTDHMAKAGEMWPHCERAHGGVSSPRHSPRGSSPRVGLSAQAAVSRSQNSSVALLAFVRQHFGYFCQIACFALTTEPASVTIEEFEVLSIVLRAGASCSSPLKRLSEGIPELCAKKSLPLKELRKHVEKCLVWNDEVYPPGESLATMSAPLVVPSVNAGRTLNISGLNKATWFHKVDADVDFLNITQCNDCIIYVTFRVRLCLIAGCHECTIIMGPVSALCSVQNCEKIDVHVAANCFKMENSIDSSAFLFCKIPPILTGDTRGIKLAPYNVLYSKMTALLKSASMSLNKEYVDIWAHPVCCTLGSPDETLGGGSFDESTSSTYHFVHPKNFQPVVIPEAKARSSVALQMLVLPQAYDDAFKSRIEEMRSFHQQLAEISDEGKKLKAQQAIQGHFKEWLQTTGKGRQLADLARLSSSDLE